MDETASLPNPPGNETVPRFALITPSASPPAARAQFNVRRRSTSRPPPLKRPRVGSTSTFASSSATTTAYASTSKTIDPTRDEAWRASSQRLLSVWDALADRYNVPVEDDDIVDIRTGRIIKDRGFTRSLGKGYRFGHLIDGLVDASPAAEGDASSEDGAQTEFEDDVDEIDAFATEPPVPIKVEMEKENRLLLAPFTEMDPADAQDLKEFLETERQRKEALGGVDDESPDPPENNHRDSEDEEDGFLSYDEPLDGSGEESGNDQPALKPKSPPRPRIPVVRNDAPLTVPEDDSEDELAAWVIDDAPPPRVRATPKSRRSMPPPVIDLTKEDSPPVARSRSKSRVREATEPARASASTKAPSTPRPRARTPSRPANASTSALTPMPLRSKSRIPEAFEIARASSPTKAPSTPRPRAKTPSRTATASTSASSPKPHTRNIQLQTPPISTRSSSSLSGDVQVPEAPADPWQAAADLFSEPSPPPSSLSRAKSPIKQSASSKTQKADIPSSPKKSRNEIPTVKAAPAKNTSNNAHKSSGPSQRSKSKLMVEVVLKPRRNGAAGTSAAEQPSPSAKVDSRTISDSDHEDTSAPDDAATGKEKEKAKSTYVFKNWADLSDDDMPPPPIPRRARTQTPAPRRPSPAVDNRKRKRVPTSRSASPASPSTRSKTLLAGTAKRASSSKPAPSRVRKPREESDDDAQRARESASAGKRAQHPQAWGHAAHIPPSAIPAVPLPFAYPFPPPPRHSLSFPSLPLPVQDPQAQYNFTQAVHYLSYVLSGGAPQPAHPPTHTSYFPPQYPGDWPQTPRRRSRTRRDSSSSPIPGPSSSSAYSTPSRHAHPYPFSFDPTYSSATEPPASSSPAPSSPTTPIEPYPMDRGRSKSRGRRVSFKLDSDEDDDRPSARGRPPRADKAAKASAGKSSARRAASVGLPPSPPKPKPVRRQVSQAPVARRPPAIPTSDDDSDGGARGSRGRTPGPSSRRAKSGSAGHWK